MESLLEEESANVWEKELDHQPELSGQLGFLIVSEVRQFFRHPRCMHLFPLLGLGVFLSAWVYPVASPFLPVVVVVFGGLELQFNNIFFRSPNELVALSLFPTTWQGVVLAKNIAAVIVAVFVFVVGSMTFLYFYAGNVTGTQMRDVLLYMATVLFPILHLGNMRSLDFPRRESGFRMDDFIEFLWMLATLGVVSIPYFLLRKVSGGSIICIVYALGGFIYWRKVSIHKTADAIGKEAMTLCSRQ